MKHSTKNQHPRHCMVVYAPYPLGETRVQREAEALVKNGYDVDVICLRVPGSLAVDQYKSVTIYREKFQFANGWLKDGWRYRFYSYLYFLFAAAFRLTRLHMHNPYTTVQVHNLPDFLVFCALIPKLTGAAILLDLHDLMPEFFFGRFGLDSSLGARLVRLQERWACRFADHVITVSEHWRRALIGRGVPAEKCSVVMNVADDQIFHPIKKDHKDEGDRRTFRLIYHGSMHQRYGLDLAVRAIDQVRQEIPGVHLLLVGTGPFKPNLKKMVDDLGLQEYVTIEPLHLAEELPDLIRSCDLGVVPYLSDRFTDGLVPTKLLEYAAMELPAVASRTTAIQAYFSDTNTEFFEPGDVNDLSRCILMLFQNPDRLTELSLKSRNFNQRYNWSQISTEYVSLVNRLGDIEPGNNGGNQ